MKVLHVCNSFDPSCDVLRCVRELNKFSRHTHDLLIQIPHPLQASYQFEEPERFKKDMQQGEFEPRFKDADVVLYHLVGYERHFNDKTKPWGFRNINIYWDKDKDKFYSAAQFNAERYDPYKIVGSSHVGAMDFMPKDQFRWLPDLIPTEGLTYSPSWSTRGPLVSFIKHAETLSTADFGFGVAQNLSGTPHKEILHQRRYNARVVIDNVCDGHWGLAGQEAVMMGLPTIVFNHDKTKTALADLGPSPFTEIDPDMNKAIAAARAILALTPIQYTELRHQVREDALVCFSPKKLIEQYWDTFIDELGA